MVRIVFFAFADFVKTELMLRLAWKPVITLVCWQIYSFELVLTVWLLLCFVTAMPGRDENPYWLGIMSI